MPDAASFSGIVWMRLAGCKTADGGKEKHQVLARQRQQLRSTLACRGRGVPRLAAWPLRRLLLRLRRRRAAVLL